MIMFITKRVDDVCYEQVYKVCDDEDDNAYL